MSKTAAFTVTMCWAVSVALAPQGLTADAPAPAQAQPDLPPNLQPSAPAGGANDPAPGSLDEVLCEIRDNAITGTHIARKRKICRTRREWMDEAQIAQSTLKNVQDADRKQTGIAFGRATGGRGF